MAGWHGQGNACFESLDAGGKLEAAKQAATAIEDAYARYRQRQTARDLRRSQLGSMCAVLMPPLKIECCPDDPRCPRSRNPHVM